MMKAARRILVVACVVAATVLLSPIFFQAVFTSAMRGYFEDSRCACGYDSFIHVRSGGYFDETPLHGMGERQGFTLRRAGEEWELLTLPPPTNSAFIVFGPPAGEVAGRVRIQGGDLYLAFAGRTNWTRHARIYNPWRIWLARLQARPPGQQINCVNNLKQIGLAFRQWAIDHEDQFPFNVSTNVGGTRDLCLVGNDGFDCNAALHFRVMSNELNSPVILVCPKDKSRKPAAGFPDLHSQNVTYQLRSGTNLDERHPTEILVVCPIDGNTLHCDGTVTGN